MMVNEAMRELIDNNASIDELRIAAKKTRYDNIIRRCSKSGTKRTNNCGRSFKGRLYIGLGGIMWNYLI